MGRGAEESVTERGSALVVVLWALVALSALALSASIGAVVDLRLAGRHREHAAALGAAEAGIAEALAALRRDPSRAALADSVTGAGPAGSWSTRWSPSGGQLHVLSRGLSASATREIEIWADPGATGWRVVGWREIR